MSWHDARSSEELVIREPVDDVSGGAIAIGFEHHEMHDGDHYFFKTSIEDTGGNGSTTTFSFTTPDTPTRIHAKALLAPDVDYTISIQEGAVVSGGVAVTGWNNDRDSSNTATLTALSGPTIDTPGTVIWNARTGGGRKPVGVAPGFNYEIIAKRNTTYAFTVVKEIAGVGIVDIDFWWYEHTPLS